MQTDTATTNPRNVSPLGDRRERPVPCSAMLPGCQRTTLAINAVCDSCHAHEHG